MAVKAACGNGFPLNIPSIIPESGGSGGTSDYSDLTNKPQINSVTLSGNKSLSDIGAASAADLADVVASLPVYLSDEVTLSTSATTDVTFTDTAILTSSIIDVAISTWGIIPEDVVVTSGSCVVTMPQVETAVTVTVGIFVKQVV